MTEEELKRLIEAVEQNEMHHAPDYLSQMILRKAEHMQAVESVEVLPIRNMSREEFAEKLLRNKRKRLWKYSLQVSVASAAVMVLLLLLPTIQTQFPSRMDTESILEHKEKEHKEYVEHKRKDSRSYVSRESIVDRISEFTDRLLEKGEEKND